MDLTSKIEWFGIAANLAGYTLISYGFVMAGFILGSFGCIALMFTSFVLDAKKFLILNGAFLLINLLGIFNNV